MVARAQPLTGLKETSALVHEALRAARIERESGRRLARLGGGEPDMEAPAAKAEVGVTLGVSLDLAN